MKRGINVILIILLVAMVSFGGWGYFSLAKKLTETNRELQESRAHIYQDFKEKQQLQGELNDAKSELQQIKAELENTKKELDAVNAKLSGLGSENAALLQEKQKLEERLHSLVELKKAFRQVKLETREQRVQRYLLQKKQQKEIDAQELARGNRGYLIKDGQSLYKPRVRIEVKPTK